MVSVAPLRRSNEAPDCLTDEVQRTLARCNHVRLEPRLPDAGWREALRDDSDMLELRAAFWKLPATGADQAACVAILQRSLPGSNTFEILAPDNRIPCSHGLNRRRPLRNALVPSAGGCRRRGRRFHGLDGRP